MEITNARIKNVTVGLDNRDRLSASMTFEGPNFCRNCCFILTDPTDVQRLVKLMLYTGTSEVQELNGKIIRRIDKNNFLRGFGDPIANKFIPIFGDELKELTESQFEELLNTK